MDARAHTVVGWLESRRILGRIAFVVVRDDAETRQLTVTDPPLIERLRAIRPQSLVRIHASRAGRDSARPDEFEVDELDVLVNAPPLPFPVDRELADRTGPSLRTLLRHPAVRLRGRQERAIFRLQSDLLAILRAGLLDDGFVEVVTPRFLSDPSEGGAELLRAAYFGGEVSLSQSTQLYRQMLLPELSRVFELTSIFHADRHSTRWHLNEFGAIEVELDGISGLGDVIDATERLVGAVFAHLTGAARGLVADLGVAPPVTTDPLPRLHYADALDILRSRYGLDVADKYNLTPTGNRLLSEWIRENHGSDVAVLVGSPGRDAQFYDMMDPQRPEYTNTFIVLCRGVSFVHGGQRLHDLDDYDRSLRARGARRDSLRCYLDVVARGLRPHGGFSVAIARLQTAALQLDNVRRAVMFPRDSSILTP